MIKKEITDLKYIGPGHIPGVPSKDLSAQEITDNSYDYSSLVGSGIYIPKTTRKAKKDSGGE